MRESYMMNFVYYRRGDRDLPYRLPAGRKKATRVNIKEVAQQGTFFSTSCLSFVTVK